MNIKELKELAVKELLRRKEQRELELEESFLTDEETLLPKLSAGQGSATADMSRFNKFFHNQESQYQSLQDAFNKTGYL